MTVNNCSEETRQELWELLYDLLPAEQAETLRAQITSDPAVARAYSEVKLRVDLLAAAAKRDEAPLSLGVPGQKKECSHDRKAAGSTSSPSSIQLSRVVNWLASLAALLLVAVTAWGYLQYGAPWKVAADKVERGDLAQNYVRTVVAGPQVVSPQDANYYTVNTTTLDGTPVSTEVAYRLVDTSGKAQLETVQLTDDNGWSTFNVPGPLVTDGATLWVETPNEAAAGSVNGPLHTFSRTDELAQVDNSTRWFMASRVVDARAPLEIELNNPTSNNLVVTAESGGRQVGQQAVAAPVDVSADEPAAKNESRVALPLVSDTSGATRLTLYDFTRSPPEPLAERYFFVAPTDKLSIALGNESDVYVPGQEAELHFQVYSDGEPVSADLRVAVVDEATYQAWGRISGSSENDIALSYNVQAKDQPARTESFEPWLVSDTVSASSPLLVLDNSGTVQAAYQAALAEVDGRRAARLRSVGLVCLVGGVLLLGGLLLAAGMRLTRSAGVLAPVLSAAAGCLLVGLFWTSARVDERGELAYAPFTRLAHRTDATERTVAQNNLRDLKGTLSPAAKSGSTSFQEASPSIDAADPSGISGKSAGTAGVGPGQEVATFDKEGKRPKEDRTNGAGTTPAGGQGPTAGQGLGGAPPGTPVADSFGKLPSPEDSAGYAPARQPSMPSPDEEGSGASYLGLDRFGFGARQSGIQAGDQRDRESLAVPTLYSNLRVPTREDGQATVRFRLPEQPGSYRVFVEGRSGTRLGLYRGKLETRAVNAAATTPAEPASPIEAKPPEPKPEPPPE